jgi:GNAT superfamily N-acetyltransferase
MVLLMIGRMMGQAIPPTGTIRKLWPTDMQMFREHLLRLDPETRRNRFAMAASDAFMERYAETSFALDAVLFGYVEGATLRAAAELRIIARREAEAAFSVEDVCRRRGIGSALFERLVITARNRRLRRLYMSCLAHNRPMQALARKFEADLVFESSDVLGIVDAPAANPATYMREAADDARGFATAILDIQTRWLGLAARRP